MPTPDMNDPNRHRAPDAGDRGTGRPLPWLVIMFAVLFLVIAGLLIWGFALRG